MPSRSVSRSAGSLGTVALVAANLLPLVGVTVWGWSRYGLLAVYWVEVSVTVVVASIQALFAERGSPDVVGTHEPLHELREKRGGVRLGPSWPPVYPRNLPFALSMLGTWTLFGGVPAALAWLVLDVPVGVSVDLVVGVTALAVAHAESFRSDYLGDARYADVSAREILRTPAQLTLALVPIAFFGLAGGGPNAVLVAVVVGKTVLSVSRVSTGPLGRALRSLADRLSTDEPMSTDRPEIATPDAPVDARVTVRRRPVLLGSLAAVAMGFVSRVVLFLVAGVVAAIAAGRIRLAAAGVLVLVTAAAARVGSYVLRYGTIEYQRRGDRLVAYDTVLDAPQWSVPIGSAARFETTNDIPDRLLDTGTLRVSGVEGAPGDTVQFGPVDDLERAVETLGLPVEPEARPERDPAVILAGVGLAASFGAVPVALFASAAVGAGEAVAIIVALGPFFLLPIGAALWAALSRV
jgi:hypothetical protein